jgi:cytosine/adenosine deaminase-related metal-dependent hydrolase/ubiquinone/menaquinone biosynthesis C-methylase UbiE
MQAATTTASLAQPDTHVFNRWARVYDAQCNPLLMLEERKATPLLSPIHGGNVLDIGCGTGRWLTRLEALDPASLTGIDCSTTMLERAREKVRPATRLVHGDCLALSGEDASYNFVMASFLLSYLEDLHGFARECARILRPEGWMLISDMHPATAAERGWTRSFQIDGEKVEIAARFRSLSEIVAIFKQNGFEARVFIEPSFENPECSVFEEAGKQAEYEKLAGVPAIYILKLQKKRLHAPQQSPTHSKAIQLTNARMGIGPETWIDGVISIEDGRIAAIRRKADVTMQALDLSDYVLLPGLINAHEHLEFGLFPNLGRAKDAPSYRNSSEWAQEIHQVHSNIIEQYRKIPKTTHLWWGAIRNLLCGATTVCHHNPLYEDLTLPDFPVRVVSAFGWSHSLAFDPHLDEMFLRTPAGQPFIVHAAEGTDEDSRNEIAQLDRMHVLDERSVLVHGLACTGAEISLINLRGASLVVCPTSNRFLFAKTPSRELLASVERIALGSDSPITSTGDLLDEVRYLNANIGLAANMIYGMVTTNSAEMLHLTEGQGRIVESGIADLIAVKSQQDTPARALAELTYVDVELVVLAGRVQMASPDLYGRLPEDCRAGLNLLEVAGHRRWVRSPLKALFDAAENVLGEGKVLIGGRMVRYVEPL